MSQPVHNLRRSMYLCSWRDPRAVDHQDGQAQFPRRVNLGSRAGPASAFGHDQINVLLLHQVFVSLCRERAAIDHNLTVRKGKPVWLINQPKQIPMLRLCCEHRKVHTSDCKKDPAGRPCERSNSSGNVGHDSPAILRSGLPRRTGQRDQRNIGRGAGSDGIGTHLCGKGMCRVNDVSNGLGPKIVRQPVNATKSANAHRDRLRTRPVHPTCIGKHCAQPGLCHSARQRAGLCRAAQDQEMRCHG